MCWSASLSVTMSNHSSFYSLLRRAARRDRRGQSRSRTRALKLLALGIFLPRGIEHNFAAVQPRQSGAGSGTSRRGKASPAILAASCPGNSRIPARFRNYPQKPSTLGSCRNDDCSGLPFLRGSLVEARSTAPPICLAGTHHLPKRGAVALGTARPALGRRGSVAFTQGN